MSSGSGGGRISEVVDDVAESPAKKVTAIQAWEVTKILNAAAEKIMPGKLAFQIAKLLAALKPTNDQFLADQDALMRKHGDRSTEKPDMFVIRPDEVKAWQDSLVEASNKTASIATEILLDSDMVLAQEWTPAAAAGLAQFLR